MPPFCCQIIFVVQLHHPIKSFVTELRRQIRLEQLQWSRPFRSKISLENASQNGSIDGDEILSYSARSSIRGRSSRNSSEINRTRPSTADYKQVGGNHITPIKIVNPKSNGNTSTLNWVSSLTYFKTCENYNFEITFIFK